MKMEDFKVDLDKLKKFKRRCAEERSKFIEFWADYIKGHPDKE